MKSKLISILSLIYYFQISGFCQIISTEGFETNSYPPAGWSIKPNVPPPGSNVWIRQVAPITNPTAQPHGGTAVSRFRSRNVTAGTRQLLISRPIDYTSRDTSSAHVDFWMFRDSLLIGNMDSLTIWISTTDTIDATAVRLGNIARNRSIPIPDTQSINGWYHYGYFIPINFTGKTSRIIFEGTAQTKTSGQGANIYIDDISFDEFPALCKGIPDIGKILNDNPVICNGGGKAILSLTSPIHDVLGLSYAWEESNSSNGPWTMIGLNSDSLIIPSLTTTSYFRCTAYCSYSSLQYTTPVDSVIVLSNLPPKVQVTPARDSFCAGSNGIQLIASGAGSYIWLPAAGLSKTIGDTVTATPNVSTLYIVRGTDSLGCWNTDTAIVLVNPLPATNITAAPNDSVCYGTRVILTSVQNASQGNLYLWSNGATSRRDTITITSDTTLSVNVITAAGCSKADTISLVSFPVPHAKFGYTSTVNTFNFTDSSISAISWKWYFGDGDSSTIQNPVHTYATPGIYTVKLLIKSEYCNDDSISVIVMSGPICTGNPDVGNILISRPVICAGSDDTLHLSAPIIGLSGLTYSWEESASPNGPWISVGLNSISLNVISLKSKTFYRCITSCSFSSMSYTTPIDSIEVTPLPTVNCTPASGSICQGSSGITLIASGGQTYSWFPSTGLNKSTGDTVIAAPAQSTTYVVTGVGSNGCLDTARVNIIVNPLPQTNITVLPNDTVCKRSTVILTAIQGGGAGNTYVWSNGKTSRRDTVLISSDSVFTVNVTNTAGCSKADTITIYSMIANFGISNTLNTFSFTDSTKNASSWKWQFGDGNTSNLQNPTNNYTTPGNYSVTLIVSNSACSDTISKQIVVIPVDVTNSSGHNELSFFPNPASSILNIILNQDATGSITIKNQLGQHILMYQIPTNSRTLSVPLTLLDPGIYHAECLLNHRFYFFKFIKF